MGSQKIGFLLAWVAAAAIAVFAPASLRAEPILTGSAPDITVSAPPQSAEAPDAARVGYVVTWDEFFGGAILLGAVVGGAIYVGLLAADHRL